MIWTEKELVANAPCLDGLAFASDRKFDFVLCFKELDRPDWLIWLLFKSGNLTVDQGLKLSIMADEICLVEYSKANPYETVSVAVLDAAKAVDAVKSSATEGQAASLDKAGNGLFLSARIAANESKDLGGDVSSSFQNALAFLTVNATPEQLAAERMRLADLIRSIISCPFE